MAESEEKFYTFDDLEFNKKDEFGLFAEMTFKNGVTFRVYQTGEGKYDYQAYALGYGDLLSNEPTHGGKKYMNVMMHAAQILDSDYNYRLTVGDYGRYYHASVPPLEKMSPKLRAVCDKISRKETAHYTVEEVHIAMQLHHNNGGGTPWEIWCDNKDSDEKSSANERKRVLEAKRLKYRLLRTIAEENVSEETDSETGKPKINPKYTREEKKVIADVLRSMADGFSK